MELKLIWSNKERLIKVIKLEVVNYSFIDIVDLLIFYNEVEGYFGYVSFIRNILGLFWKLLRGLCF